MPSRKDIKKVGYGTIALSLAGIACVIYITNGYNYKFCNKLCSLSMGTGALGASIVMLGKALE